MHIYNLIFLKIFLVFERLSTPPVPVKTLKADFYNLAPGSKVSIGEILFQKIEVIFLF
jgi:hypothetical protein